MTNILEGKRLSRSLAEMLAREIGNLDPKPKIAILQIGNLKESNTYVKNKKAFAEGIGAIVLHKKYPKNVRESLVISDIKKFNADSRIHGIMIQLPAPPKFDIETVLETINPKKDVDGLTALNMKRLFDQNEAFIPATAKGVVALLDKYKVGLIGKKIVIVGASNLVGRPVMLVLLNRGATVTVCHKDTKKLKNETRRADILITAVGKPKLITKKHVSKNQIIIDIGITVTKKRKVVGDVDFENVSRIVRAITPVPGGVGPMTVASLFQNLLSAYKGTQFLHTYYK